MRALLIIVIVVALIALIAYLAIKDKRDTFNNSVDYALTLMFMDNNIDADTYIAYTSMKANEKYQLLHDIRKMEAFKAGKLFSDYSISEKLGSSFKPMNK